MRDLNSIGGYFELETCNNSKSYHKHAIALNTGRNALEFVLKAKNVKRLYLPYFTCDVLLEPLKKLGVHFEFYSINDQLEPVFNFSNLTKNDFFLYTNYFGLKDVFIQELSSQNIQLIIDNAQAFYSRPYKSESSIYSARKFFGVPDGAYVYCDVKLEENFKKDVSFDRMGHLLIRKDLSAEAGYSNFIANDKLLENQPIRLMSSITSGILSSIDFEIVANKRIENYKYLHNILKSINQLDFDLNEGSVPMVYPLWTKDSTLRQRLLENKIYTAIYWPNVKQWCKKESIEYILADEVIYLPIDQRYGFNEMNTILKIIAK
ncbi:hypothetical protein B0A80_20355 [Flavobacterium tructae]|uniref:hypothetical protein n=1 Tax=Flavobacterium tructae TaxID=1114873 RepID=UPI000B5C0F27|nr:hypothetical protein [Flavobacterium tructae]OXB18907.1 hypothetical protein B0A80_20355 [Flavobacterium tructae]